MKSPTKNCRSSHRADDNFSEPNLQQKSDKDLNLEVTNVGDERETFGNLLTKNQIEAASRFIKATNLKGIDGIIKEYETEIRPYVPANLKYEAFTEHETKNRFKDVVCMDHSRVILNSTTGTDYIHANYVMLKGYWRRRFIAAQNPIDATVNDYWLMVFQTKSSAIVTFSDSSEELDQNTALYFPQIPGTSTCYGNVLVYTKTCFKREGLTVYTYEVSQASEAMETKLLIMHNWPDRGRPPNKIRMLRLIRSIPKGTCIVNCTSGIGRTATVIAIGFALYSFIKREQVPDISEIVRTIRTQRVCAVQTDLQYLYIYAIVLEYINLKITSSYEKIIIADFMQHFKNAITR
ncbi:unnamed protein product [Bursaphelenchus okinawaensis]|uniref:Tyrosine-protein phosphatase domain-containing protein n=1 Tax=Bursaphelenchus okinawaensis TaxID=465554 RepID=A0A811JQG7_9BILA|nr:unnamed protein product [Bursaphelenchus okinawaensis]CAG9077547.1 unnamed protein product [Bursaphelenchus okinawaensis]